QPPASTLFPYTTLFRSDFAAGTGRLMLSQHPTSNDTARYDAAGNTELTYSVWIPPSTDPPPLADRASYYDAENRLREADYRTYLGGPLPSLPVRFVLEKYRYDGFGRRVWVKTQRHCLHPGSPDACAFGTVRRTIWD